mmetsp:Transcript_28121/g.24856  ORF Transcript_28121/g.24856 Transcript_28121/m.24856 type:complete len:87 (+) Transcript_28121:382-642(+)
MISTVIDIEEQDEDDPLAIPLSFEEVVHSLIKLIDIKEMTLSPELTQVGLKMFRIMIERENKGEDSIAADWETEDYSKYKTRIFER